ncbi:MAG: 30S ribosomal protein S21 [Candidatus Margulisiibacteriota bacterium]|jgi:small subunit ribosomal protein S21
MAKYTLRPGEDLDKVLKKFRRKVKQDGIIDDIRKREYYEKPSESRKRLESVGKRKSFLANLDE